MIHKLITKIAQLITYSKMQRVQIPHNIFYAVVRNTEEYNKFIPWCKQSEIIKPINNFENFTKLTITFNDLSEICYTSHVHIVQGNDAYSVTSICKDPPLKYLKSVWAIQKESNQISKVIYSLDFEFQSLIYQLTSSIFLNTMGKSMWDIFLKRAKQLKQKQNYIITQKQKSKERKITQKHSKSEDLQNYLQRQPQIFKLYRSHESIKKQIDKISKRLQGTQNFNEKLHFQIKNLLSHQNLNTTK